MRHSLCMIAAISLWQLPCLVAQAQLVEVRPGYVRAPFVRVYRDPFGGSRVQAPFVDVYRPGFRRGYYVQQAPPMDFRQADWRSLSQAVRDWTARVEQDLSRFPSGEFWTSSLKTAEVAGLMPVAEDAPPAEHVRARLQEIVATYDSLGDAPEVGRIVSLASFQNLRAALREYTTPVQVRQRRQLALAAGEFNRSLAQFNTASTWQNYFALEPGGALSSEQLAREASRPTPDLAAMLGRFDAISADDQYPMISSLPAFRQTRDRLASYLGEAPTSSSAPAEELPVPQPDEL